MKGASEGTGAATGLTWDEGPSLPAQVPFQGSDREALLPARNDAESRVKLPRVRNPEHDNNFDLIRLLAASQVLFQHSLEWLKLPHPEGWPLWAITAFPGVPVFFCISGFLVTKSFIDCRGDAIDFGLRRALRIYPGLATNLLIISVLLVVGGNLPWHHIFTSKFILWWSASTVLGSDFYGFLLVGSPFDFSHGLYPNFPSGVLWSISVELGFYVLVPFAFANFVRHNGLTNLSILFWGGLSLTVGIILATYGSELPANINALLNCSPFPFFWIFLIGAAIQVNWKRLQIFVVGKAWIWLPLYLAASWYDARYRNVSVLDFQKPDIFIVARAGLLALAVVSSAYTLRRLGRILCGIDLSYPVYLYHMQVVMILIGLGFAGSTWGWPAVIAGTAAIGLLSWFFVEKPCLRQKKTVYESLQRIARRPRFIQFRELLDGMAARRRLLTVATFSATWLGVIALTVVFWSYAKHQSVAGVLVSRSIYEIKAADQGRNWTTMGQARAVLDGNVILLNGDLTQYGFQLQTDFIQTDQRGDYLLKYSAKISGGSMGVGVLDGGTGRWIKTIVRFNSSGALRFQAPSKKIRVIIFNSNATPHETTAEISGLGIYPVEN